MFLLGLSATTDDFCALTFANCDVLCGFSASMAFPFARSELGNVFLSVSTRARFFHLNPVEHEEEDENIETRCSGGRVQAGIWTPLRAGSSRWRCAVMSLNVRRKSTTISFSLRTGATCTCTHSSSAAKQTKKRCQSVDEWDSRAASIQLFQASLPWRCCSQFFSIPIQSPRPRLSDSRDVIAAPRSPRHNKNW